MSDRPAFAAGRRLPPQRSAPKVHIPEIRQASAAMPSEKTLSVVLRLVEFSESSCVVTLFTRDFGKIGALAKGARRPKSPFESALDLLAVCRIVFLRKSSESLDLLTEARLERRFRAATRDLSRLYAGYYVAELLNELTDSNDPHPELYDAADNALRALDGDAAPAAVVLRFEWTALRLLGHLPSLDTCGGCGGAVPAAARVPFGPLAGGVLCPRCRVGERQIISVSADALQELRRLAGASGDKPLETPITQRLQGELRGVSNHYLTNLVGRRLRMHEYLGRAATPPRRRGGSPAARRTHGNRNSEETT